MLHLVQTLIRDADQNVFLITVRREYCNSIIHSQSNTGLHGLHRGPEISANAARQRVRLFAVGMHKQKREFIAADAKSVVRCSQRFAQCGGGSLQKQIALRMPVSVVDLFALMQVKKRRCRNWPRGRRSRFSRVSASNSRKDSSAGVTPCVGSLGLGIGPSPIKNPAYPNGDLG